MKIQISKIQITADNPRKEFNVEKVRGIGESILRHGQIHPIIVRSLANGFYNLVTGEMRVRGCMAVGLEEIDADVRTLTDMECKVLRLIENVHREDLTDAEKGDAVIELAEATDKAYKDIAETELNVPYQTVRKWVYKGTRTSEKVRQCSSTGTLNDFIISSLLKYSHDIQDQLATFIVDWNEKNPDNKITSTNIGNFCKDYDKDPNAELEDTAKKITGFVPVTIWQPKPTVPTTAKDSKPKNPKQSLPDLECCIAMTKKGKRCQGKRLPDLEYCSRHKYEGPRISKPKLEKKPKPKSEDPPHLSHEAQVFQGDFMEVSAKLQENSIDFIITDPPYGQQFLHLYKKLGEVASRLLKLGGSLLVMAGQSYLPDVFDLLRPYLMYNWTVAYLTPGGQSAQLWERKVNTFWKPVLWFVKGKYNGDWVGDVTKSAPNDNEKQFIEWQQSESGIADLVERFTKPNDLILDPLMGSATTGIVATRLGRRFIGIDIDPKMVEIAKQRMGIQIDREN